MNWDYDDRSYDSANMRVFHTGQKCAPAVFATESGDCFIMSIRYREGKAVERVRHLGRPEALLTAERFRLPDLKAFLMESKRRNQRELAGELSREEIELLADRHLTDEIKTT